MWKFSEHKVSNTLVTPYCIVWGVLYPILNTSVGYCLFVFGSFHNLRSNKLIISTLSFYIYPSLEIGGHKPFITMKAKHLLFALCVVLFGATSCDTLNDLIEAPETPSAEYYTVSLGFSGEIEVGYEPLRSAENNDLYGIQVYTAPADAEGNISWTNYAYGLFDDPTNIKIDLLAGYQYKFAATMVKDGKEKMKLRSSGYNHPFTNYTDGWERSTPISTSFNYGSTNLGRLHYGYTELVGYSSLDRPNTERYYGELEGYTPSNNGKATIDMGRTSYGIKFIAQGQSANAGTLEIKMSCSPVVTMNLAENNEYFDIYTFYYVRNAWLKSDYSEEISVNINYIREDETVVPLGGHTITAVRNTTTVVTVNIGYGGAENGLGFNFIEDGELPDNPDTAMTITNGSSSNNDVEL